MYSLLKTAHCTTEISKDLIRLKASGSHKWIILFDGKKTGQWFELVEEAIKVTVRTDGFSDSIQDALEQILAKTGATVNVVDYLDRVVNG